MFNKTQHLAQQNKKKLSEVDPGAEKQKISSAPPKKGFQQPKKKFAGRLFEVVYFFWLSFFSGRKSDITKLKIVSKEL